MKTTLFTLCLLICQYTFCQTVKKTTTKKPNIYSNHKAEIYLLNGDTLNGFFKPNLLLGGLGYKKHLLSQYKYGFKINGKKTFFKAKDIKGFSFKFDDKIYNIVSESEKNKKTFVELIYDDNRFRLIAYAFSNPLNHYDMYPTFYHCLNKKTEGKIVIRDLNGFKVKKRLLKELFSNCIELEAMIDEDFDINKKKEANNINIEKYIINMINHHKKYCE